MNALICAPSRADAAMSAIRGAQDAQRLMDCLSTGCARPDALQVDLQALHGIGDGERLRAFLRALQKRLERLA